MSRKQSDETTLVRMVIKEVLDTATEPMTAAAIAQHPAVVSMGVSRDKTSQELSAMYRLTTKKPFPLCRLPSSSNLAQYEYYNPDVVKLAVGRRATDDTAVNDVNTQPEAKPVQAAQFAFNPVEFQAEPANAAVSVPAGVKSITLTIGGVNIRIELNS